MVRSNSPGDLLGDAALCGINSQFEVQSWLIFERSFLSDSIHISDEADLQPIVWFGCFLLVCISTNANFWTVDGFLSISIIHY